MQPALLGVLTIAFVVLSGIVLICGLGVWNFDALYIICIALCAVTCLLSYAAAQHVYTIKLGDKKSTSLIAAVAGLVFTLAFGIIATHADSSGILLGRHRECVYLELKTRYCYEFPEKAEDVTTLGAIGASTSSLMFIIGAIVAFVYELRQICECDAKTFILAADGLFSFISCGFYAYIGAVSFGLHATHCYDWWRMDVGAVRAFPYVAAVGVFSGTDTEKYEDQVKWHSLSFSIPLFVFTFTRSPFWTETENTSAIVAPGAVFCGVALARDAYMRGMGPASIVALFIVGGSALLIAQGEPGGCDAAGYLQPVALAHLTLGMTPIALSFLRDRKVRYMRSA
jgi:hypothetical protein